MPPKEMKPLGQVQVGVFVEATREAGDNEFEPCKVKEIDSAKGILDLVFVDGFVRKSCPVTEIKFDESKLVPKEPTAEHREAVAAAVAPPSTSTYGSLGQYLDVDDEAAYASEMGPQLPAPPTAEQTAADEELKYAYIKAYKDVGNSLFKAGKLAWAVKTYVTAVDALTQHCYESEERMLWDYFARGPCGQCYSNAALCSLKQGEYERAHKLCVRALACQPEDTDLVKVLLRDGQALLGLGQPEDAKEALEKAVDKEPSNRAVREELLKAKKAVKELHKARDSRLFASVDLSTNGLTTKKEAILEQLQTSLDGGFEALVMNKDAEALTLLMPLLEGKHAEAKHRRPATMLAAYGVGVARYQSQQLEEAQAALQLFWSLKAELDADGEDYKEPMMGYPLVRFYLAHTLFERQQLKEAQAQALLYLEDVKQAGPQKILNMPAAMLGRAEISDAERAASRFRVRSCSGEAVGDAHMMLAIVAERLEGPRAAIPHFEQCIAKGNDQQKVDAHQNLEAVYTKLHEKEDEEGALAKRDEHRAKVEEFKLKIAAEKEAAKSKAEKESKMAAEAAAEGALPDESESGEDPSAPAANWPAPVDVSNGVHPSTVPIANLPPELGIGAEAQQ